MSSIARLPDFIIIGAPRSGTTYLARNLATHPQVYLARPGEEYSTGDMHFFDVNQTEGRENYQKGVAWYVQQFAGAGTDVLIGEKTADYLEDKDAPRLIHEVVGPSTKLVVVLRNPVLRAYSHYLHLKPMLPLTTTFASVVEDASETNKIVQAGYYHRNLSRYLEYFPRENIHIMVHESLIADPGTHFKNLFRFLGVDSGYEPPYLRKTINQSQKDGFAYYIGILAGLVKRRAPRLFVAARNSSFSRSVKNIITAKRGMDEKPADPAAKPTVDEGLINGRIYRHVFDMYRPDIEALASLTGIDLLKIWKSSLDTH